MIPARPPRKRHPRKNLITIDGTLEVVYRFSISVGERGAGAEPFDLHIIHREAVREFIDCNNPNCYNGGFSLGNLLREMVANRQEEFIGASFCTGQEGNPDDAGPHPSCATRFQIEATLRYR